MKWPLNVCGAQLHARILGDIGVCRLLCWTLEVALDVVHNFRSVAFCVTLDYIGDMRERLLCENHFVMKFSSHRLIHYLALCMLENCYLHMKEHQNNFVLVNLIKYYFVMKFSSHTLFSFMYVRKPLFTYEVMPKQRRFREFN
jgi:hypothetical protein